MFCLGSCIWVVVAGGCRIFATWVSRVPSVASFSVLKPCLSLADQPNIELQFTSACVIISVNINIMFRFTIFSCDSYSMLLHKQLQWTCYWMQFTCYEPAKQLCWLGNRNSRRVQGRNYMFLRFSFWSFKTTAISNVSSG
jgi:hypothetical protein